MTTTPQAAGAAAKELLPEDFYDVEPEGAELRENASGGSSMVIQVRVCGPRRYAGRKLYFSYNEKMTFTLENLAEEFGLDAKAAFDEDPVWTALTKKTPLRANVKIQPADGDYPARNRVTSLHYPKTFAERQAAKAAKEGKQGKAPAHPIDAGAEDVPF